MTQKIKLITLFAAITCIGSVYGQVTIGSGVEPAKAALLEIKSQSADAVTNVTSDKGGLGLPRVELVSLTTLEPFIPLMDEAWDPAHRSTTMTQHAGLMVYNLKESSDFKKAVYVWDGKQWGQIGTDTGAGERYFYLPSFNLPLPTPSETEVIFNLHDEYVRQFTKDAAKNPTFISSNTGLSKIPSKATEMLYDPLELDYVITYYDTNIIKDVSISSLGELRYKVKSQITGPNSFMNVVFVIKKD